MSADESDSCVGIWRRWPRTGRFLVTLLSDAPDRPRSSPDTLKNGAIIGALVGAVTLGAFGALICNLEQEPGAGNCLSDTLRVAAIGAGIGAGIGLTVDAALAREAGITVRLGLTF